VRQHLRSIISFGGGGVAVCVPFPKKRCAAARERILEILRISSSIFLQGDDRTNATSRMTYARRSLWR
ncbi:hypothetical protein, partial [Stenotrophomonas maltophilia]|uniref:hypothetical protein n=1 Tax=Stenotrophomonas maltophilia TaxID=40324 RepID=UPI001955A208